MLANGTNECSCKKTNCERHGKCEECIGHHKNSSRYPKPYCMQNHRKPQKQD
ncbi:hypothetical protein [Lacrimispora sp. JR3]|uniref:hypothetical protein n=1 Tax=Lacrimispora sinapis TaxID=3111456 RepID=UPI003748DA4B